MVKIKSNQKDYFLYNISRLYYIEKISQNELARIYKVSKATISRGLKEAEEKKIVQININDIFGIKKRLEEKIENKYKIKKASISIVPGNDKKLIKKSIGREGAELVGHMIKDNISIGIAWGTTLFELVNLLEVKPLKNIKVLDLIGSMGNLFSNINASELARRFGKIYNGKNYFLNSLAVVNNRETKKHLIGEKEISDVLKMQKDLDIAIISIGTVSLKSSIISNLNLRGNILKDIKDKGGVGDICLRYFGENGEQIKTSLNNRVIGIELEDYKKIKTKVCISGGLEKLEAIKCALSNGLIDILVTDSLVAESL